MNEHDEHVDQSLKSLFERNRAVVERDAAEAQRGRAAFLGQAQGLGKAVSPGAKRRHNEWFNPIRKERFAMLATILVILGLLFGGSGATVYAAQGSMPDGTLYPVKAWSEDVRDRLTADPQARCELMLQYAEQRAEEIAYMARKGEGEGDPQLERLRLHLDEALQQATRLRDQDMERTLAQMRDRLREQDGALQQAQQQAGPQGQDVLTQAREMVQTRMRLAAAGIEDPYAFRRGELRHDRQQQGAGPQVDAPGSEDGASSSPGEDIPAGGNPWTTGTPTPGSGYGPGPGEGNPWTTGTPTPGSGYGPGPGEGSGANPWTTGTPTPGSGYGPGPGDGDNCAGDCGGSPDPGSPNEDGNGSGGGAGGSEGSGGGNGGAKKP